MSEKVLRPSVELVRKSVCFTRFDVGGTRRGIIRAGDSEEMLARVDKLAEGNKNSVHRHANRGEDGCGFECIISDRAGQAKRAGERALLRGHDLQVSQLFFRDGE